MDSVNYYSLGVCRGDNQKINDTSGTVKVVGGCEPRGKANENERQPSQGPIRISQRDRIPPSNCCEVKLKDEIGCRIFVSPNTNGGGVHVF
jgi:hypothetical protein